MGIFQKSPTVREEKILKDELRSDERSVKAALKEVKRCNEAELKAAKEAHNAIDDHQKAIRRVDKIAADITKLQAEQEAAIGSRDSLERNIDVRREEHIRTQQETIDAKARLEILQAQIGSKTVSRQERLNELAQPVETVPPTRVTYVSERAVNASPEDGSLSDRERFSGERVVERVSTERMPGEQRISTERERMSGDRERMSGDRDRNTVPVRSETVEYAVTNPSGTTTAVTTTRTHPLNEHELAMAARSPVRSPMAETFVSSRTAPLGDKVTTSRTTRTSSIGGEHDVTTTRTTRAGPGTGADADVTTTRTGMYGDRETTSTHYGTKGERDTYASRTSGERDSNTRSGTFGDREGGEREVTTQRTTTMRGNDGGFEEDITTSRTTKNYDKSYEKGYEKGYERGLGDKNTNKKNSGSGGYEQVYEEEMTTSRYAPALNTGIPSPRFVRETADYVIPPNSGIAQPAMSGGTSSGIGRPPLVPPRMTMERNLSAGLAA